MTLCSSSSWGGGGRQLLLQDFQAMGEDIAVGLGDDRQFVLVVADKKGAFLEDQAQFAVLQHPAVLVSQDRQQDLVLQLRLHRVPVDVEEPRIGGAGAVLQEIHPEAVVLAFDAHVIRDDVENLAHLPLFQGSGKGCVLLFRADLGIQAVLVEDVVAVQAPVAGFEVGGGIDVGNPQLLQVRDQLPGIGETEMAVELQAVSGRR